MNLQAYAEKYNGYQIEMRRHFHANPEVSAQEFQTATRIREELTKAGIEWRQCGQETGTLATIHGRGPGRKVLLRGDIDALSVTEDTGVEYASRNPGVMHACGHDCHISMLLTAAMILNDIRESFDGTVVLAFQPAEELGIGADAMIKDGALDGVDACFGMHVWADVTAGKVSLQAGPRMAGADRFKIEVIGQAGHGAQPHHCVDATVAGAAVMQSLQSIVSREISPVETGVVTVGTFNSGSRWNVISGKAELEGTARYYNPEVGELLPGAIERVAKKTAEAYRASINFFYERPVPVTINDAHVTEVTRGSVKKIFGEDGLEELPPTMGGEDFGYFLQKVPGAIAWLGIRNPACGAVWGQHSEHYNVDESVLVKGALLHTQAALDLLND